MPKYICENCFHAIDWHAIYVEDANIEHRNLTLTFEGLTLTKDHPFNPFHEDWETNEVIIVLYDVNVLMSGYYDCSAVRKQVIDFDTDCVFVEVPLLQLLSNFTIVTEHIHASEEGVFKQSFEGFAPSFGDDAWGYFELQYTSMRMMWDSFHNEMNE